MIKTGWIMSALVTLFLLGASAAPKLINSPLALEPMEVVGWPAKYLLLIGIIEVVCAVLYIVPRTALLGAVLMTGLLGAALAANLRVDNPLFSHTLFSVYLGFLPGWRCGCANRNCGRSFRSCGDLAQPSSPPGLFR